MSAGQSALQKGDVWKLILACLAMTAVLYHPALRFGFVADDIDFVYHNPHWLWDALLPTRQFHYYPLNRIMIHGLTALSGWRPAVMHGVNLLLHAGIGVCLGLWLSRMRAGRAVCFIAPLFFVSRGIGYEVVAWITELSYLAVVVYTFISLYFWDRYLKGEGRRYLAGTAVTFAAALLTMEHALVLVPLYFLYDALAGPERSLRSDLALPARRSRGWLGPYARRLFGDARRYVPFVLVILAFQGVKFAYHSPVTWSGTAMATEAAPVPSGFEVIYRLPPERTVFGMLNSPQRAYRDLLVSTSYLFFPTAGCFSADDTWISRLGWLALLPWLLIHLWVLWKGPPITRFLLGWVYIYILPLAVAGVPQARYYYMATVPASALMGLAVVAAWSWLRTRLAARAVDALAVVALVAVFAGEGVFIRARLGEWKLSSDMTRQTLALMRQDLDGRVDDVYLINFPQWVPSTFFPPFAFDFPENLPRMLEPPRASVTVHPVYDRTFVGRWPTVGRYASLDGLRRKLDQPRQIAYRFVDRPPWVVRWP